MTQIIAPAFTFTSFTADTTVHFACLQQREDSVAEITIWSRPDYDGFYLSKVEADSFESASDDWSFSDDENFVELHHAYAVMLRDYLVVPGK